MKKWEEVNFKMAFYEAYEIQAQLNALSEEIENMRQRQYAQMGNILDQGLLSFTDGKIKKAGTRKLKSAKKVYGEIKTRYLQNHEACGSTPDIEKVISRTGSLLRKINDELESRKGILTKIFDKFRNL